jgi:2-polyprenyl-3-methyl-5-hydroxy-6-metoxy-1,4-benzoquinol methylase
MAVLLTVTGFGGTMTEQHVDTSTDIAWEEWGSRDPYFGVITDPKYRRSEINEQRRREFFESGELHVHGILSTIRKHIEPGFAPRSILDFGCGVGRLLGPFASIADDVIGLDVSPSMLLEARRNCDERQLRNVSLLASDDSLSALGGSFDLIHSCIVFQHIPVDRGRALFAKLLQHLRPGGVGAIQLTYSKTRFASTHGIAPAPPATMPAPNASAQLVAAGADPEIQMNPYNVNEILFLMQCCGVQRFHVEFSDHGGELGVYLFFSVTGPAIVV